MNVAHRNKLPPDTADQRERVTAIFWAEWSQVQILSTPTKKLALNCGDPTGHSALAAIAPSAECGLVGFEPLHWSHPLDV